MSFDKTMFVINSDSFMYDIDNINMQLIKLFIKTIIYKTILEKIIWSRFYTR